MTIGASLNLMMASNPAPDPAYKLSKLDISLGIFSYQYPGVTQGVGAAQGQSFSSDGTYMYSPQSGTKFIGQSTSATPYEYSNAPIMNYQAVIPDLGGCFIKPDGSKFWVSYGGTFATVQEYDCITNYQLETAVTSGSVLVTAAGSGTRSGVFFSLDGTKMYISSKTSETVEQYSVTTPWDISGGVVYDAKQLALSTQITVGTFNSIYIKPDGLKLWAIATGAPSAAQATIYEYTLSTAWDVSTGTYSGNSLVVTAGPGNSLGFKDDGTYLYVITTSNASPYYQAVISIPLSTAWNIITAGTQSLNVLPGSRFAYSTGCIVPGGNYVLSGTVSSIAQLTAFKTTSPWNFSGTIPGPGLLHTSGGDPYVLRIRNSDTKVYLLANDNKIYEYTLSVAKNLDSANYTGRSLSISTSSFGHVFDISQNGTKLIVVQATSQIHQYTLSTPWDLSTATITGIYGMPGLPASASCRIAYSTDGYKVIIDCEGFFYSYPLGTAWDVSTAGSVTVSTSPYYLPTSLEIGANGSYLLIGGSNYTGVYSLTSQNTPNSGLFNGRLFQAPPSLGQEGWYGGEFNETGTAFYSYRSGNLRKFDVSTPWDINTASLAATNTGLTGTGLFLSVTNDQYILLAATSNRLFYYKMTTPGDVSTATLIGAWTYSSCRAARFSNDGAYAYIVVGSFNVYSYPLTTPFDLSTVGTGVVIGAASSLTSSISLAGPDEKYMLLGSYANTDVRQYTKSGPGMYASPSIDYRLLQPPDYSYNTWISNTAWIGGNGKSLMWMTPGFTSATRWTYVKYNIPA